MTINSYNFYFILINITHLIKNRFLFNLNRFQQKDDNLKEKPLPL